MYEPDILVCKPVSFPGYVVPGSLPIKCCQCGQGVWIAPSSILLLHDNPEMEIKCIHCVFAQGDIEEGTIEDLIPSQVEEIQEYWGDRKDRWHF